MNHERFEQLLALRLYGEVDAGERAELDAHLAMCAECTRAARELESGLGAFAGRTRHADELDLAPLLARALETEPFAARRAARLRAWVPAAASFAAGVLATWLVVRGAADGARADVVAPTTWERFHADTIPPPAGGVGALARWTDYARR